MNARRITSAMTLIAMAVTACAAVGCIFQPAMEPPTRADKSIDTTAAKDPASEPTISVLVQGSNGTSVAAAVRAVGGEVTHELGIIDAVGARLTQAQIRRLGARDTTLRIQADRTTSVSGVQAVQAHRRQGKGP